MDEKKIEVIKTYPRPTNQKQLRSFLGLCNYWRRFICSYSAITHPLRSLLLRDVPVVCGPSQQDAFDTLIEKLCNAPILSYPDIGRPFIVTTDASKTGLGFILSQLDSEGRERVISYNGRATKSYEKNYTISELELSAVISALQTYHPYISNAPFTLVTDHLSLQYLNSLKLGNSRLIRSSLLLSQYHFTIKHVPGRRLAHVDCMSRRQYPPIESDESPCDIEPTTHLCALQTQTISQDVTDSSHNKIHEDSETLTS